MVRLGVACGPSGFESETVIDSVRVLATRVDGDKSYAQPGDTVTLETLTVDGRRTETPPAVTYWIPFVCEDPVDDLYYACFAPLLGGDAGAPGGAVDAGAEDGGASSPVLSAGALAALLTPGTDLTPLLPTGSFTFTVPQDAIALHPPVNGTPPYGLIIIFNIACAGKVKTVGVNPTAGPQQVPLGCFDDAGNALGADQYVIGYSRVFVSQSKVNPNPRIAGFLFNGTEIDAGPNGSDGTGNPAPITLPPMKACHGSCDAVPLDMDVPASSWSAQQQKSIWVDYYAKGGNVGSEARLLYDVSAGRVTDTGHEVMYTPPDNPGPATIWAVVHDSDDGVTWLQLNVVAQ